MKRVIGCILLVWGVTVHGQTIKTAAAALQEKLNSIHTMRADFQQIVTANKRTVSRSSGLMALSRPGRFRWQTQKPMAQTVIADGDRLWVYDVDLEQVTVKAQHSNMGNTVGLFLSENNQSLARDFDVVQTAHGAVERFDLHARSNKPTFQRVQLTFIDNALRGIVLFDPLGQQTSVQLSHVKTNLTLVSALFQFKIPNGVDVVNQ